MNGATTIQERLKDLRLNKGLKLEELAEQTGISKSALGSYEKDDYNLTSLRRSGKVFVFGKNSILCPFAFPCGKTYGHLICIPYMKKYLRFLTPFNTVSVYLMESKKRHRISYGVWDRKRVLIFHISTLYPASI